MADCDDCEPDCLDDISVQCPDNDSCLPGLTGQPANREYNKVRSCSDLPTSQTCPAPSTACSETFRGTTPSQELYLAGKNAPGDKCLNHLTNKTGGFVMSRPNGGQHITQSPEESYPIAQGFLIDAKGQPLRSTSGDLILGANVRFKHLHVSGVEIEGDECLGIIDPRVMSYKAPSSSIPIYLKGKDGYFSWGTLTEDGLCSELFPTKVLKGRLLVIDEVEAASCNDQPCDLQWCVREYDAELDEDKCAVLTVTQDENGTQLTKVVKDGDETTNGGILHFNKETGCPEFEREEEGLRYVDSEGVSQYLSVPAISEAEEEKCYTLKVCRGLDDKISFTFEDKEAELGSYAYVCNQGFYSTSASDPKEIVPSWNQVDIPDTDLYEASGTGITLKVAGMYRFGLSGGMFNSIANNNSGNVFVGLFKNGALTGSYRLVGNVTVNDGGNLACEWVAAAAAGDTFSIRARILDVNSVNQGSMRTTDPCLLISPLV